MADPATANHGGSLQDGAQVRRVVSDSSGAAMAARRAFTKDARELIAKLASLNIF